MYIALDCTRWFERWIMCNYYEWLFILVPVLPGKADFESSCALASYSLDVLWLSGRHALQSCNLCPIDCLFRFDGRIVAKLPFVPISLLQGLSHRNLRGDDYTDCSFIFFYILCTMSIRQVWTLIAFSLYWCCLLIKLVSIEWLG